MKTQAPELSIVMSVYNGEDDLDETLESILSQKGCDFEVIVVDDGSQDRSAEILAGYCGRHRRLRVLHQENQGLTRALIRGCEEASGRYIARHDVGDVSHADRLRLQREALDSDPDLTFVSCWTQFCGPAGEPLYVSRGQGQASRPIRILSQDRRRPFVAGPSHHASVVFRRETYEKVAGYREEFYYCQDWDLWGRLAEHGTFQMLEEVLYTARFLPGGISAQNRRRQRLLGKLQDEASWLRRSGKSEVPVLQRARAIRPSQGSRSSRRRTASGNYYIGSCLLANGDFAGLAYLRKALVLNPFSLKCWLRLAQGYGRRKASAAPRA